MIGQGKNNQRIQRWMTAIVFGPNATAGGLSFTLFHAPIHEVQRLLRKWELESIPEQLAFRELIEEIDNTAAEEATELGWIAQRFDLHAASAEGQALGSLTLRYAAATSASGAFTDSEPATKDGQVALAMRHTNTAFQLLGEGYRTILDVVNRRFAEQDRQLERSQDAQSKVYDTMAELAEKRFEREVLADTRKKETEIELRREVAQLDRSQMLTKLAVERVAPLIPALMNRIIGKGTVPTTTTPLEEVMAGIFETLTEEQLAGMQNVLTPSQMAGLAMLLRDLQGARQGGKPGAAGTGTASRNGRFSEETPYIAIEHIQKELLPWAIEQIRTGQPLNPPVTLAKPARMFQLFAGALTRPEYDDLLAGDVPFNAEEREAFVKLAETFNLVPPPVQTPTAKSEKGAGQPQK
jgi:hypothetical protein